MFPPDGPVGPATPVGFAFADETDLLLGRFRLPDRRPILIDGPWNGNECWARNSSLSFHLFFFFLGSRWMSGDFQVPFLWNGRSWKVQISNCGPVGTWLIPTDSSSSSPSSSILLLLLADVELSVTWWLFPTPRKACFSLTSITDSFEETLWWKLYKSRYSNSSTASGRLAKHRNNTDVNNDNINSNDDDVISGRGVWGAGCGVWACVYVCVCGRGKW